MKLYTKTGDDGTTGLLGKERVEKDHVRVEAYGTVDEANAAIGGAHSVCDDPQLRADLASIMSDLFALGADLATTTRGGEPGRIGPSACEALEQLIDRTEAENAPLKNFILPTGGELAARLHLARAVVRRAERRVAPLVRDGLTHNAALIYLNRLSDLLFALARLANRRARVEDVPWRGGSAGAG